MQKKTPQNNLETNFDISTPIEKMKIQIQSTKCRRRLSETEEETRLFCVNKELMTLIDTTPFCNLISNCFSKMLSYHLHRLVPISIMN